MNTVDVNILGVNCDPENNLYYLEFDKQVSFLPKYNESLYIKILGIKIKLGQELTKILRKSGNQNNSHVYEVTMDTISFLNQIFNNNLIGKTVTFVNNGEMLEDVIANGISYNEMHKNDYDGAIEHTTAGFYN